ASPASRPAPTGEPSLRDPTGAVVSRPRSRAAEPARNLAESLTPHQLTALQIWVRATCSQFVAELFPKRPLARLSRLTITASAPPAWSAAPSANAFGDVAVAHHEVLFRDNGLSVTQPLSAALGRAGLRYPPPCRDSGSWLLPGSWANWADFFKQAGYAPLMPDWPDDPET